MKLSAFLLSVLTVSSASAFATSSFPSSTDLKIPGDSPLELCNKEHRADIIHIDRVDLNPNPPEAGHELIIKAKGTVHQTIEEGAYVLLVVKYGLIKLLTQKADLCEQITNVNMECPIEKGAVELTKSVELPNEIPPGKYTVFADVYTKDDEPITCLTATVVFSLHKAAENLLGVELEL